MGSSEATTVTCQLEARFSVTLSDTTSTLVNGPRPGICQCLPRWCLLRCLERRSLCLVEHRETTGTPQPSSVLTRELVKQPTSRTYLSLVVLHALSSVTVIFLLSPLMVTSLSTLK